MHSYAQTNIQLYKQLPIDGYSGQELSCIRDAYEFAMQICSCSYRPSGKTNIAHFVGTASILSTLRVPVKVVAAGLLHNVYGIGDFGTCRKGISETKRKEVRHSVGQEVEEYVARYAALEWNAKTIPKVCRELETLDPVGRDVILVRLADQMEVHLDRSILYYPNAEERQKDIRHKGCLMIEMAEKLGFPTLAAELKKVFEETILAQIPVELRGPIGWRGVVLIVPRSYRRSLRLSLYQEISHGFHHLRRRLASGVRRVRSAIDVIGKLRS